MFPLRRALRPTAGTRERAESSPIPAVRQAEQGPRGRGPGDAPGSPAQAAVSSAAASNRLAPPAGVPDGQARHRPQLAEKRAPPGRAGEWPARALSDAPAYRAQQGAELPRRHAPAASPTVRNQPSGWGALAPSAVLGPASPRACQAGEERAPAASRPAHDRDVWRPPTRATLPRLLMMHHRKPYSGVGKAQRLSRGSRQSTFGHSVVGRIPDPAATNRAGCLFARAPGIHSPGNYRTGTIVRQGTRKRHTKGRERAVLPLAILGQILQA